MLPVSHDTGDLPRTPRHRRHRLARYVACRWLFFAAGAILFIVRIYTVKGFYIVAYGLSVGLLLNLIGLLNPQITPDAERLRTPLLQPSRFRRLFERQPPPLRHIPEFPCWVSSQKMLLVAFGMTFFGVFDIPVFVPILAAYFVVLAVLAMRRTLRERRRSYGRRLWVL